MTGLERNRLTTGSQCKSLSDYQSIWRYSPPRKREKMDDKLEIKNLLDQAVRLKKKREEFLDEIKKDLQNENNLVN